MGRDFTEIAQQLKDNKGKVQLVYAFNGTGKTRLSREFRNSIAPKSDTADEQSVLASKKVIYYNAFTEDLFYWDNDLDNDVDLKLKIHPNSFTEWILNEQGQDRNVITHFKKYSNRTLEPKFNSSFSEVAFSIMRGNDENIHNIKISKSEESSFVWSVFYTLLREVIEVLNTPEKGDRETDKLNQLEYVFIDDPVTSLDENHLIQLAVDLAQLINNINFESNKLKFIITTHNPLFYNVLHNELGVKEGQMLTKSEDGSYDLESKFGGSNKTFSYHHYLINTIKQAVDNNKIEKYHFVLLRNLYEKTANFLGYSKWSELLPDDKESYASRLMNFYSHLTLTHEEISELSEPDKEMVKLLFNHLIDNSKFYKEAQQ